MHKKAAFDSVDVTYTCSLTGAKEKDLDRFEKLREKFGYSQKLKEKQDKEKADKQKEREKGGK